MKRVLVTGGTGFLGANLMRRLVADGHEVHLIVRANHSDWRLEGMDVPLHVADLSDVESVRSAVAAIRPEWVFHLAAHGQYSWETDVRTMIQTNMLGTANLLQVCNEAEAFVNTGSSSEYGLKDHPPAEDEVLDPNSTYAVTKGAATGLCRLAGAVTLRLYSVYGPYEHPDRLIPTLIRQGRQGRLPPLVDPDVARDFVYVDDVVEAYLLAVQSKQNGAVYNVGTGVQTTIREVVDVVRRVFGLQAEPRWGSMPNRHWDTSCWVANSQKIRDDLGWQPAYDFDAGFKRTVELTH